MASERDIATLPQRENPPIEAVRKACMELRQSDAPCECRFSPKTHQSPCHSAIALARLREVNAALVEAVRQFLRITDEPNGDDVCQMLEYGETVEAMRAALARATTQEQGR